MLPSEIVRAKGLAKGYTMDNDGHVCVRGAIILAVGGQLARGSHNGTDYNLAKMMEWDQAVQAIVHASPATWNNEPARTIDEVIMVLEEVERNRGLRKAMNMEELIEPALVKEVVR